MSAVARTESAGVLTTTLNAAAEQNHSAALQVFQSVVGETLAAQQGQITVLGQEVVLLRAQTAELREVHAAEVESLRGQAAAREAELLAQVEELQRKYDVLLRKADNAPEMVAETLVNHPPKFWGRLRRGTAETTASLIRNEMDWSNYRNNLREEK